MRWNLSRICPRSIVGAVLLVVCAAASGKDIPAGQRIEFNISAPTMMKALIEFTEQSGLQLAFPTDGSTEMPAPRVVGRLTPREALEQLLQGSGLKYQFTNDRTISVTSAEPRAMQDGASMSGEDGQAQIRLTRAQTEDIQQARKDSAASKGSASSNDVRDRQQNVPEVLVTGSKILNMDIKRSRDDIQPYVVFDREVIERSGATGIDDLLKNRLPMNSTAGLNSQGYGSLGNISNINLRGLGSNQTLILIDGRRAPASFDSYGGYSQPDLNGIPLSAVERIEVLPTTASGIYGGSATGGVINVILKRDYQGVESKLLYENTFDSNTAAKQIDLAAGFNFAEGKTNLLLSGSYANRDGLKNKDRAFTQRYLDTVLANYGNDYSLLFFANPPYGGTTNIRSASGANLSLKTGTPLNSPITFVPEGYAGRASDGGAAFVANAGRYNTNLSPGAMAGVGAQDFTVVKAVEVKSMMATLRQVFTPRIEGFLDFSHSENIGSDPLNNLIFNSGTSAIPIAAAAPNNPFAQDIVVSFTVPDTFKDRTLVRDLRLAGGGIFRLPGEWTLGADYVWSKHSYDFRDNSPVDEGTGLPGFRNAVASGAVDVLRDTAIYPFNAYAYDPPSMGERTAIVPALVLRDATLRFAGPLLDLPAGKIVLSGSIEHRDESTRYGEYYVNSGLKFVTLPRSQTVDSAYMEARIPIVSERNARRGIRELQFQLAVRRDEYTTRGVTGLLINPVPSTTVIRATNQVQSTDPTLAVGYSPIKALTLRASYGTGFLPPTVNQITPSTPSLSFPLLSDPLRGNTAVGTITSQGGGNADLKPEKSESWSAGLIVTPQSLAGLRLSVDYTRIKKSDAIVSLPLQQILDNLDLFSARVVRGANLPGDQPGWAGPITFIDRTSVNISTALVEAYDLQLDYEWSLPRLGSVSLYAMGTYQERYDTRVAPTTPVLETVGYTSNSPLRIRANAGLSWAYGNWKVNWAARYFDSYFVYAVSDAAAQRADLTRRQGAERIPSQIYHDLLASYTFGRSAAGGFGAKFLSGTEVALGIKNIFNTVPPFDASLQPFYSVYADPRMASYYVTLKRSF